MQERLKIEGLNVSYGKTVIVENLNLAVGNETVVLFGASGCGKTTILKSILGASEQGMNVRGSILFDGQAIPKNKGMVGMVFQGPILPPWMKVANLCKIGCNIQLLRKSKQNELVDEMLERFEIQHLKNRYPYQLSGGQKQRVALAVTLLNQPKILLLDEPTTFLDDVSKSEVWSFIENNIRTIGMPIIIVSHDSNESVILGDKIYKLSKLAYIDKIIEVPFKHPRSEDSIHESVFWNIRGEIRRNK
jgi:ABC-type nitrate/sulfonate/bicarbonate transport system ATPase subunit